jgi:hypothetical protein
MLAIITASVLDPGFSGLRKSSGEMKYGESGDP